MDVVSVFSMSFAEHPIENGNLALGFGLRSRLNLSFGLSSNLCLSWNLELSSKIELVFAADAVTVQNRGPFVCARFSSEVLRWS